MFKNRLMEKVRAAADPPKTEAVIPAEIQPLYLLMWEHGIKRHFDGSSSDWSEPIPGHLTTRPGKRPGLRASAKRVTFTGDVLREIFDPTVNKIARLVREQVEGVWQDCEELPKSAIVCGGFSGNPYLQNKTREQVDQLNEEHGKDHANMRFEVAPEWLSRQLVATDCAMRASEQDPQSLNLPAQRTTRVASRIARASYAIHSSSTISPHQFITKGEGLLVTQPKVIHLAPVHFNVRPGIAASLTIYRGQETTINRDRMVKDCEISWTGAAFGRLSEAVVGGLPVQLSVGWSNNAVGFEVSVNGTVQTPGMLDGFCMDYAMHDA
ncbi:hypothetical protein C8A01DRAFT_39734 [Parachaetomium inaequale]|uniref:Uncharacterized protein n=1 Tax=Parachaetomium inaequale TaxID=2588326 RepID=A0AAN6P8U0_9PEZI|nr:hypothetical protein C8A01DRAFT_39734 [Parachaetomium inaequale]